VLDEIFPRYPAIFILSYILYEDIFSKSSPYPDLIKKLISDYGKAFVRNRPSSEFVIALFDKDWKRLKEILQHTPNTLRRRVKRETQRLYYSFFE
jgi:hypothetical protein